MRLMLDTCVIYPTVMREMLLGAAKAGFYEPRWSARIIEEWTRAAARLGPEGAAIARGEAGLMQAGWPGAMVSYDPAQLRRYHLPDPDDVHVLVAAIAGSCDGIVTVNAKDFPRNLLAEEGLYRSDPDSLLVRFCDEDETVMAAVAQAVLETANRLSPDPFTVRSLMKKARLPRLGKRLEGVG